MLTISQICRMRNAPKVASSWLSFTSRLMICTGVQVTFPLASTAALEQSNSMIFPPSKCWCPPPPQSDFYGQCADRCMYLVRDARHTKDEVAQSYEPEGVNVWPAIDWPPTTKEELNLLFRLNVVFWPWPPTTTFRSSYSHWLAPN